MVDLTQIELATEEDKKYQIDYNVLIQEEGITIYGNINGGAVSK